MNRINDRLEKIRNCSHDNKEVKLTDFMGHFSRRYAPDAHPVTVYMHHQTIDSSGESLHLCHHTARCHFARLLRQFSLKSARIAELGGTIHSLCGKFADIDPLSVSHPKTRASPHPIIPLRVLFITYLFASLEGRGSARRECCQGKEISSCHKT